MQIKQEFNIDSRTLDSMKKTLNKFETSSKEFLNDLLKFHGDTKERNKRIKRPHALNSDQLIKMLEELSESFGTMSKLMHDGELKAACSKGGKKAAEYAVQLQDVACMDKKEFVYYTELENSKNIKLVCQQIDVAEILQ
jgi:ribosomal protein L16 Arg81 hydroxylase